MGFIIALVLLYIIWGFIKKILPTKPIPKPVSRRFTSTESKVNHLSSSEIEAHVVYKSSNPDLNGNYTYIFSYKGGLKKFEMKSTIWNLNQKITVHIGRFNKWQDITAEEYLNLKTKNGKSGGGPALPTKEGNNDTIKKDSEYIIVTVVLSYRLAEFPDLYLAVLKNEDGQYRIVQNKIPYKEKAEYAVSKAIASTWKWFDEERYQKIKLNYDTWSKGVDIARAKLSSFGIEYLYHMTHITNVPNILANGLQSHTQAHLRNLTKFDIADQQVNSRRSRHEPLRNRSIHSYVPLYFNPKNPMLYRRKDIQKDVVILAIDTGVMSNKEIIFTDGNAASGTTKFYDNLDKLDDLNWECINGLFWHDFQDGKRIRCAEVLVYPSVAINTVKKIYCCNNETHATLKSHVENYPDIKIELKPNLYFQNSTIW